jgi:hypothetical protein
MSAIAAGYRDSVQGKTNIEHVEIRAEPDSTLMAT